MNREKLLSAVALGPVALALAAYAAIPRDMSFSLTGPFGQVLLALGAMLSVFAGIWVCDVWRRKRISASRSALQEEARAREIQSLEEARSRQVALLQADHLAFRLNLDETLRNHAMGIQGVVEGLKVGLSNDRIQGLAHLSDASERLGRLVVDLRTLRPLEEEPIQRAPVDLAVLLQEVDVWAENHPNAHERQLFLSPGALPLSPVPGEEDLLYLMLQNLLDNALKYTRSGDRIELRALQEGSHVIIEVTDTGPGIAQADLPHIWEALWRSKSVLHVPGSGVGLAMVRAIVDRHGGQVTARSCPGQGTAFTVRLPLDPSG